MKVSTTHQSPILSPLAEAIWNEEEFHLAFESADQKGPAPKPAPLHKISRTLDRINDAMDKGERAALAFSGGSDSLVLLDLVHQTRQKPFVIWIDSQMEWPGTREFIQETVSRYKLQLRIARAERTPEQQWARTGWPMLGKRAAREWMQQHSITRGFKINVSECCRTMKIQPARRLTRNLGCTVQITGQRGQADDNVRGLRTLQDGHLFYQKRDRLWIANPLTGWTDEEIRAYITDHSLKEHPAKIRRAHTIGCIYCGGGSQFTNSGLRVLRQQQPDLWHDYMIKGNAGFIILSLKHNKHLHDIQRAVQELGGLTALARERAWVFDFTRKTPLKGYSK